jgi:hypothetical protein
VRIAYNRIMAPRNHLATPARARHTHPDAVTVPIVGQIADLATVAPHNRLI